ncbi:unnamed protein product [Protopolystoma xenopodis]|uniref:C2 domain-containing protein n=1 Tax=Protopolystoma xenopodis TaxID=117903 RepID=A0A448WJ25_9PLAT|nr:unnamed protein product [Protopolystoma xenopodis]
MREIEMTDDVPHVKSDNSWIERITIYQCPLEEVPEFGGFVTPVRNFPLYRGKQEENEISSEQRLSGYFKDGDVGLNAGKKAVCKQVERCVDARDWFGTSDCGPRMCFFAQNVGTTEVGNGNIIIYPLNDVEEDEVDESHLHLYASMPRKAVVNMTVRVYVVRCFLCIHPILPILPNKGLDLHPTDLNGKADPFLILTLGSQEMNDKSNYKPRTLMPIFGRMFEFNAHFPMESILRIQVCHFRIGKLSYSFLIVMGLLCLCTYVVQSGVFCYKCKMRMTLIASGTREELLVMCDISNNYLGLLCVLTTGYD